MSRSCELALRMSLSALVLVAVGAADTAGCSAAEPLDPSKSASRVQSSPESSADDDMLSATGTNLKAKILEVTVAPGCGLSSPLVTIGSERENAMFRFSEALSGAQLSGVPKCNILSSIDVPTGYAFSFSHVTYRGFGATSNFRRTYTWSGSDSRTFENPIPDSTSGQYPCGQRGPAKEATCYEFEEPLQESWSPSCEGSTRVQLNIGFEPIMSTVEEIFYLDSLEMATSMKTGTSWRACDNRLSL